MGVSRGRVRRVRACIFDVDHAGDGDASYASLHVSLMWINIGMRHILSFKNYLCPVKCLPLLLALFLFSACGDSSKPLSSDSTKSDSQPADRGPVSEMLKGDTILPRDTSLVLFRFTRALGDTNGTKLTANEVRKRFWPLDTSCEWEARSIFGRFFHLDSLRVQKKEDEGDPIGSIVKVDVRVRDTVALNAGKGVVWTMTYESYPACPVSYGTYFMLSTYKDGKLVSTRLLGKNESFADAPAEATIVSESILYKDNTFKGIQVDSTGDACDTCDVTTYEVTKTVFLGKIANNGMIDVEVKDPHK